MILALVVLKVRKNKKEGGKEEGETDREIIVIAINSPGASERNGHVLFYHFSYKECYKEN
jgi:hypothetical protein